MHARIFQEGLYIMIDWCLTLTLAIFQLYHGIAHDKKEVLNINGQYNSTNMIKANDPLSSPQIIEHRKRPQQLPIEIQVLAWDRHKNMAGLNQLIGSQPSSLDNRISNGNMNIKKTCTDSHCPVSKVIVI